MVLERHAQYFVLLRLLALRLACILHKLQPTRSAGWLRSSYRSQSCLSHYHAVAILTPNEPHHSSPACSTINPSLLLKQSVDPLIGSTATSPAAACPV